MFRSMTPKEVDAILPYLKVRFLEVLLAVKLSIFDVCMVMFVGDGSLIAA